jgi:hypothetical protein
MLRREFLLGTVATMGRVFAGENLRAHPNPAGPVRVRLTLDFGKAVAVIPPDFIGLGYEISSVAHPGLLSRSNQMYLKLVRTLGSQGVIRVGGNTSDYSIYAPSLPARSSPETGPGSVVNPAVLDDLGSFLEATGWRLIWGLNLGRGTKDEAVEEAKAVMTATGSRLLAFEIGNEPDLFSHRQVHRKQGYSYDAYLSEYRSFRGELRKALPSAAFAGPDVAVATDWVTRFARDEGADLKLLTHHYYREGQNPSSTIEKLLVPDPKLEPMLTQLRAASTSCGVPYRICETNSFSGGGKPGVSDRFASALWVLDFMYELASANCAGVNMQTGVNQLGFISSYSPIGDDGTGAYRATPEFYGMLAFASGGSGELLAVRADESDHKLKAYATRQGRDRISITLINKDRLLDAVVTVAGTERLRGSTVLRLSAQSLDAGVGITFGGATVDRDGDWRPVRGERIHFQKGELRIPLPAASAAVLALEA